MSLPLPPTHSNYRPDIDGLRAVAVLSVVVFHAFPQQLRGGFIGVDVFFVISGYLISLIILENLNKGTFRFLEFYSRRIRRIFPALFLVLAVSYAVGWFTLLANEYKQLGKHLVGGASFSINFLLWRESGYFDNATETKPLLHLWSLSVEEQFYIIYPLLLWLAWKRTINLFIVTMILALVSFYLNVKGMKEDAIAAFYLPQTRLWELMCGGIIAWLTLRSKDPFIKPEMTLAKWLLKIIGAAELSSFHRKTLANIASLSGIFLLLFGFRSINQEIGFPGKWALIPIVGSMLIIGAGQKSWLNRVILSHPIAVWFGLTSYPLYLWHWPLLTFPRIILGEQPNQAIRIVALIISIILAWLTYQFLECPVRSGFHRQSTVVIFSLLMASIGLVGYVTYLNNGLTFRKDAFLQNSFSGDTGYIEVFKYYSEKYFPCTPKQIAKESLEWKGYIRCKQSKSNDEVDTVLIGDSHAEHLFIGLAEALPAKNIAFYIKASLPFLENPDFHNIYKVVAQSKSIRTVILTTHWIGKYSQIPKGTTLEKELIKVVDFLSLSGKKVYLTDDVPIFPFDPEKCKGTRRFARDTTCKIPLRAAQLQIDVYLAALTNVVKARPLAKLLRIGQYLCNRENCSMADKNSVLYRDQHHLNIAGSLLIGRHMVKDNQELFQ